MTTVVVQKKRTLVVDHNSGLEVSYFDEDNIRVSLKDNDCLKCPPEIIPVEGDVNARVEIYSKLD